MRILDGHKVNLANDTLTIEVKDWPGSGGAHHHYRLSGFDMHSNRSAFLPYAAGRELNLFFQNGPIAEVGVNGITHEALIAILIDRLECFQKGPFANEYNAAALLHLQGAQASLQQRTRERMARGVEGTHMV